MVNRGRINREDDVSSGISAQLPRRNEATSSRSSEKVSDWDGFSIFLMASYTSQPSTFSNVK